MNDLPVELQIFCRGKWIILGYRQEVDTRIRRNYFEKYDGSGFMPMGLSVILK